MHSEKREHYKVITAHVVPLCDGLHQIWPSIAHTRVYLLLTQG